MEIYMDGTHHIMRYTHNTVLRPFFGGISPSTKKLLQLFFEYSDDLFIRTRLFPNDISGLMSFPDYSIAH